MSKTGERSVRLRLGLATYCTLANFSGRLRAGGGRYGKTHAEGYVLDVVEDVLALCNPRVIVVGT